MLSRSFTMQNSNYRCALGSKAFLLNCFWFSAVRSSSDRLSPDDSGSNSVLPIISVSRKTLVETVAPSFLFFPSLRDCAIFSIKSHSLPSATISPVSGFRRGVQSGESLVLGGIFEFLLFNTEMMPSSSKRVHAFFRVSLLTASKYDRSPWWYRVLPS
jgi:hypothetical protein